MSGEPESYEMYEVFIPSGPEDERFRKFVNSIEHAEYSWKDTQDV
mgnify:CR=1 FL=1